MLDHSFAFSTKSSQSSEKEEYSVDFASRRWCGVEPPARVWSMERVRARTGVGEGWWKLYGRPVREAERLWAVGVHVRLAGDRFLALRLTSRAAGKSGAWDFNIMNKSN